MAFQTVTKDYRPYHYKQELNKKFAEELEEHLAIQDPLEAKS